MIIRIVISIAFAIATAIVGGWIFLVTIAGFLVGGGPGGGLLPEFATIAVAFFFAVAGFGFCFYWMGRRSARVRTDS